MKISGRQLLPVETDTLWAILHDPLALKEILPGCDSLDSVGPDEYRVTLMLRIGTVTERFTGLLRLHQVNAYSDMDFQAEGESSNGMVSCRGRLFLETQPGVDTALCYEADIDVGGRLAQISPRLLETTARAFARRCQEGLEKQSTLRTKIFSTTTSTTPLPPAPQSNTVELVDRLRRMTMWIVIPLGFVLLMRIVGRRQARQVAETVVDSLPHAPEASPLLK